MGFMATYANPAFVLGLFTAINPYNSGIANYNLREELFEELRQ